MTEILKYAFCLTLAGLGFAAVIVWIAAEDYREGK